MSSARRLAPRALVYAILLASLCLSLGAAEITPPEQFLGFKVGADFHLATYEQALGYIEHALRLLPDDAAILDTPEFLDPNNTGRNRNRAAVAQTFVQRSRYAKFTVAVNHFKSKGGDTPMRVAVRALRNRRDSRTMATGISAGASPLRICDVTSATRRYTRRDQSGGKVPTRAPCSTSGLPMNDSTGNRRSMQSNCSHPRAPATGMPESRPGRCVLGRLCRTA